ncbi:S-layer homology domain-containing protein [Peptoniphilus sp. MSJ-1]|uniref:S-layer homology domain-containing protein n=1 Tax=Peptoniphilus ovalis TaxID=2841503 RepID=A0ABS6FIA7_9FIRM|nr:S-layer homology domain-containing protein [Peptoniphilus ovalis]MBU5669907.1 S-layer homology domain-containing protein [Peptoniphilus ovalis]
MNKKILSLVLALVMVLGTFTSVFAEAKTTEAKKDEAKVEKIEKVVGKDNKIQYVKDLKIVEGDEKGNLNLESNVKRSEITKVLVIANGEEEAAKNLQGVGGVYKDLKADHWANGYIVAGTTRSSKVNDVKMLNGYPDDTFKAENDVTYAELAKMLVVLAKKDLTVEQANNAVWYRDWINWANELGIFADVTVTDYNKAANRADTFTMLYNALYTMKEFKRVPSNETRGILSNLTKDVIQLNQDSKAEYKVTNDTVFVTGENGSRTQIRQLRGIDKEVRDYYLGSLVRVLVNDKNEVTHIIELGNPAELARGNNPATAKADNTIWRGVSDNTVETTNYAVANSKIKSNDDVTKEKLVKNGHAFVTVQFKSNNTKVDTITFNNVKDVKNDRHDLALKVTDKTEIYVANPANNIMKKVANINEALSLVGFQNYRAGYPIFDVYAGFDSTNINKNYGAIDFDTSARHTANVVVFNLVNKTFKGELFRVVNSSSSNFRTTLERTDGTLVDRNNVYDTSRFPLEYGDLLDVIELDDVRTGSIYTTVIDHSDTDKYPIVKITEVKDKLVYIEDKNGERSVLDARDADIFSEKQYGKLEAGTSIQFSVNKDHKNQAEVISLLGNQDLKGSIYGIIPSVDKAQRVGKIISVQGIDTANPTVTIRVDYNVFNSKDASRIETYSVSNEDAKALKAFSVAYPERKVDFKVSDRVFRDNQYATNFKDNTTGTNIVYTKAKTNVELLVEKAIKADKDFRIINDNNIREAKDLLLEIKGLKAAFGVIEETEWGQIEYTKYEDAINAFEQRIQLAEKNTPQKQTLAELNKVTDTLTVTIANQETLDHPEKINKAINDAVKALVDTTKFEVYTTEVQPEQKIVFNGNRKAGIKVTLEHKTAKHTASKNILVTVKIQGEA